MKHFTLFAAGAFGVAGWVAQPALAQTTAPAPPAPPEAAADVPAATTPPPGDSVPAPAPAAPIEPPAALAAEAEAKPSSPATANAEAAAPAAPPASATSAPPAYALPAAAAPEDSETPPGFSGKLGSHQEHWFAWLGVRNDYVRDANYDLFAPNDALTVFSVGGGRTVWVSGNFSVAAFGLWEIGAQSDITRGNEMYLRVQRLEVGPEARYHVHYRLYAFGRLGLGAEYIHASLKNGLFPGEKLVSNSWMFASDLTGGAAVQFYGDPAGEQRRPRAWFVAEGGYALTSGTTLSFAPESGSSGAPERAQTDDLGALALSAPFFRLAVAGSY